MYGQIWLTLMLMLLSEEEGSADFRGEEESTDYTDYADYLGTQRCLTPKFHSAGICQPTLDMGGGRKSPRKPPGAENRRTAGPRFEAPLNPFLSARRLSCPKDSKGDITRIGKKSPRITRITRNPQPSERK